MTESTPATSITDAESVVMEVLWRHSTPVPTETVVAALEGEQHWQEATTKTLLNRLLNGFDGKLTTSKWAATAKCSPDTALRDIGELVALGVLRRSVSGGRSTAYELAD